MVKITNSKNPRDYVPSTQLMNICGVCKVQIPRKQMVHATRHWNGDHARCKPCTQKSGAPGVTPDSLLGWVHDSVGAAAYVSAQVAGVVEDDSNASVVLN
tara:strand:- start:38 stop:337 length:300 start_codon:yes stop_codon:yes gene_type:complete